MGALIVVSLMAVYSLKRAFDVLALPLAQTLGIGREDVLNIPAMFPWMAVLAFYLGPKIDRKPLAWFLGGGMLVVFGFWGMAAFHSSYGIFLIFVIAMALGMLVYESGVVSFLIRPFGFGLTYDLISIGVARSATPIVIFLVLLTFWKSMGLGSVFLVMGAIVALAVFLIWRQIRDLEYVPNLQARIVLKEWAKRSDFWRLVAIFTCYEGMTIMVASNFRYIMEKYYHFNGNEAVIWYLVLFCGFGIVGRCAWAWNGNFISTRLSLILGLLMMALGMWLMTAGPFAVYFAFALLGLGSSAAVVNLRPMVGDRYGQEEIMSRCGAVISVQALVSMLIVKSSGLMERNWSWQLPDAIWSGAPIWNMFQILFFLYGLYILAAAWFFAAEKDIVWKNKLNGQKSAP